AIISNPTGSATIPSSAATLSQLAAPLADMKSAPPKTEKNTKTATRPMNEPISGLRTRPPIEGAVAGGATGGTAVFAGDWSRAIDFMCSSQWHPAQGQCPRAG